MKAPDVQGPRRLVAAHDVADDLLFAEHLKLDGLAIRPEDLGDRRFARPERDRPIERLRVDLPPGLRAVDRQVDERLDDLRALDGVDVEDDGADDARRRCGDGVGECVERGLRQPRRRPGAPARTASCSLRAPRRCCSRRCCRADGSAAASSTRAAARRPGSVRRRATRTPRAAPRTTRAASGRARSAASGRRGPTARRAAGSRSRCRSAARRRRSRAPAGRVQRRT